MRRSTYTPGGEFGIRDADFGIGLAAEQLSAEHVDYLNRTRAVDDDLTVALGFEGDFYGSF